MCHSRILYVITDTIVDVICAVLIADLGLFLRKHSATGYGPSTAILLEESLNCAILHTARTMAESKAVRVIPLNGSNYPTWKVQCQMALGYGAS